MFKPSLWILYSSVIIWLLPPIRQYGTKYFYYFLIIATGDILASLYVRLVDHDNNLIVYLYLAIGCLVSIIDRKYIKGIYLLIWASAVIPLALLFWNSGNYIRFVIIIVLHLGIMLVFLKTFILELSNKRKIDFLLFMMIFYEGTIITKFSSYISSTLFKGTYYLFITSAFEISIAVIFILFKYGSSKLIFQLK